MTSSIKNTCLTRSAIAIAPTNEAILAFSPFSIPAPSLMMPSFMTELCVGGLWLAVYSPTTEFRTVSANKSEPSFETDPKVFPGTAGYASKVYEAVSAREPWCASLKVSAIVCNKAIKRDINSLIYASLRLKKNKDFVKSCTKDYHTFGPLISDFIPL